VPDSVAHPAAAAMTLGFGGEWQSPSRSRHGGPLPSRPGRPGLHRTLRLIMTVAAAAAGLCLVVGLVAMVAGAGAGAKQATDAGSAHSTGPSISARSGPHGPGATTPATPTPTPTPDPSRSDQTGPQHGGHLPTTSQFVMGKTIDFYKGSGSGERGMFDIAAPGNWGLAWQFDCPQGRPGDFVLGQIGGPLLSSVNVKVTGSSSHGLLWITKENGWHSVVVVSECSWIVRVVMPRA
jgi:hypothetical protein